MQHLDFYGQLDRHREAPFSARQQMLLLGALATVMLMIAIFFHLGRSPLADEVAALRHEQQQGERELEQLRARRDAALADTTLRENVAVLQREHDFLRRVVDNLGDPEEASTKGFGPHLAGLARQHVDGLWFNEISLFAGGTQLALSGQTREPEYLPRYLNQLNREPLFHGQNFRVFRMSRPETEPLLMDFEIRALEAP